MGVNGSAVIVLRDVMLMAVALGVLVKLKLALLFTPGVEAVTVYAPEVLFALNTGAVAMPLLLVVTVVAAVPLAKVPLGPLEGAEKVTLAPASGFPDESTTVACRGVAKAVETVAD